MRRLLKARANERNLFLDTQLTRLRQYKNINSEKLGCESHFTKNNKVAIVFFCFCSLMLRVSILYSLCEECSDAIALRVCMARAGDFVYWFRSIFREGQNIDTGKRRREKKKRRDNK